MPVYRFYFPGFVIANNAAMNILINGLAQKCKDVFRAQHIPRENISNYFVVTATALKSLIMVTSWSFRCWQLLILFFVQIWSCFPVFCMVSHCGFYPGQFEYFVA